VKTSTATVRIIVSNIYIRMIKTTATSETRSSDASC